MSYFSGTVNAMPKGGSTSSDARTGLGIGSLSKGPASGLGSNHSMGDALSSPKGEWDNELDLEEDSKLAKAKSKGVELLLPTDVVLADEFSPDANSKISQIDAISGNWMGLDIGPDSIKVFQNALAECKTIIWNGPMGVFEMEKFENGTKAVGESICLATENGAFSLVGGGDSIAAVKKFNFEHRISYMSTGGGAMLEYLEGKQLPGIVAILD